MPTDSRGCPYTVRHHLILRERRCPVDEYGYLVAHLQEPTGRLLLKCDEVDEMWWSPDDLDDVPTDEAPAGVRPATAEELVAGGWDITRFDVGEYWQYDDDSYLQAWDLPDGS
ncbi:MAG: hypothetical protein QOI86_4665 [Actinomycetota bacterium]|jgi:hypothetical protein|nr:hypothetical protein [Actinomycetota bacterium]